MLEVLFMPQPFHVRICSVFLFNAGDEGGALADLPEDLPREEDPGHRRQKSEFYSHHFHTIPVFPSGTDTETLSIFCYREPTD